jgi:hypothetical protein
MDIEIRQQGVGCIRLTQDRVQWRSVFDTVMKLCVLSSIGSLVNG